MYILIRLPVFTPFPSDFHLSFSPFQIRPFFPHSPLCLRLHSIPVYIPQDLNYTSWLYLRSFLLKATSPSAQVTSTSFLGPAASKHSTSRSRVKERTPLLFLSNFFSIFVVFLEQKNKC